MNNSKIAAIILAAGYSSRMKAFKPLLPLGRVTILERVISLFKTAGFSDVRVVTGFRAPELIKLLNNLEVTAIVNEHFRDGMFSSIVAGVSSLNKDKEGFFLLPVDIPLVRRQTLLDLYSVFQSSDRDIIYPCFRGKRGHPPLISARFIAEIRNYQEKGGLRSFLAQHQEKALDLPVADEFILLDMDKADDYQHVLDLYAKCDLFSGD